MPLWLLVLVAKEIVPKTGMSLWLLVAKEIVLTAGTHHGFLTRVLLKTNPAQHQRANETLPCPYNAVCWIHMEV
jgi:hypothetical protein